MKKQEKIYIFSFEDRGGNEIEEKETACHSLKEAREFAKTCKANTRLNDLHKIVVRAKY